MTDQIDIEALQLAEREAMQRWNAEADAYNQWSELGLDEQQELIAKVATAMAPKG